MKSILAGSNIGLLPSIKDENSPVHILRSRNKCSSFIVGYSERKDTSYIWYPIYHWAPFISLVVKCHYAFFTYCQSSTTAYIISSLHL